MRKESEGQRLRILSSKGGSSTCLHLVHIFQMGHNLNSLKWGYKGLFGGLLRGILGVWTKVNWW